MLVEPFETSAIFTDPVELEKIEKTNADIFVYWYQKGEGFALWRHLTEYEAEKGQQFRAKYGYSFIKGGKLEQIYPALFSMRAFKQVRYEHPEWPETVDRLIGFYDRRLYRRRKDALQKR